MEGRATREAYGEEILALGKENKDIYVVDADIGKSCKTVPFSQELPDQHVNVGIAEQNAAGVGAGLATTGKIPFVTHLCDFRIHENGRTDPSGNLLPQTECENSLFPRRIYSCQ